MTEAALLLRLLALALAAVAVGQGAERARLWHRQRALVREARAILARPRVTAADVAHDIGPGDA